MERARHSARALSTGALRPSLLTFGRACCLLFLVLVCADAGLAVSLSDYHERVRRALVAVGSIGTSLHGAAAAADTTVVRDVRQLLPATETIEWQGGLLRVDNSWLGEALDNYELLPVGDNNRVEAMARIAERLQAIDERLSEMERSPSGKTIDKEEEKARLAAILRREEYNRQAAEGNALTRFIKRIRDWLRNLFGQSEEREQPQRDIPAVNNTAQVIVILFSLAVIVYIAWRFLPRFLGREMRKRKPRERGARVVLGEQLAGDESSADLLDEAEKLARAGDLRAAIRKGYIALLCELHDRKLVRLEQHKTNRDYLRAVEPNRTLYEEMKPMTRSFENHWYGLTPATETDWQDFRSHYNKAVTGDK
ncbi:MAG TPA: DUF4129 domain-containing protein [Pyrinomonadaceae bacterium]